MTRLVPATPPPPICSQPKDQSVVPPINFSSSSISSVFFWTTRPLPLSLSLPLLPGLSNSFSIMFHTCAAVWYTYSILFLYWQQQNWLRWWWLVAVSGWDVTNFAIWRQCIFTCRSKWKMGWKGKSKMVPAFVQSSKKYARAHTHRRTDRHKNGGQK